MTSASTDELPREPTYALTVGGQIKATDADEDGERRIREHLGSILRLNALAVLVGAGASFHIKGPEIRKTTIDKLRDMLRDHGGLSDGDSTLIGEVCGEDTFNLETLLERLNAAVAFASTSGRDAIPIGSVDSVALADISALRKKLNTALVDECNLVKKAGSATPWSVHQTFFRKLLSIRRDLPQTRVFTTNYDLAIEYALDEAGMDYIDGFKGTVSRSFHPEVYGQVLYTAPSVDQRRMLPVPNLLYIYKLHGSINWRGHGKEPDRKVVQVPVGIGAGDDELALIYPTQDKESSALGYPYADLIRALNDTLLSREVGLITIGYGFGDDHINRVLDRALASNYTMQMLMVDPRAIGNLIKNGEAHTIEFSSTTVGQYAARNDARISAIAGTNATFEYFSQTVMPDLDVEEPSSAASAQRHE